MFTRLNLTLLLSAVAALVVFAGTVSAKTDKVELCKDGNTIEVAESAVAAQLATGATLGACAAASPSPSVTVIPTPTPTATPTPEATVTPEVTPTPTATPSVTDDVLVDICFNGNDMRVAEQAVDVLLNLGATLGSCATPTPSPTVEIEMSPTPEATPEATPSPSPTVVIGVCDQLLDEVCPSPTPEVTPSSTPGTETTSPTPDPTGNSSTTGAGLQPGLHGTVYEDRNGNGQRDPGEPGIEGVTITVSSSSISQRDGALVAGALSTKTNAAGVFSFIGLPSGVYTLHENQPGFVDGRDFVGSLGGILGNDTISGINFVSGQTGINYDFGEGAPLEGRIPTAGAAALWMLITTGVVAGLYYRRQLV